MIHCDFETYSEIDIKAAGAFRYAEDPSTEALILAYAIDDQPIVGVDLTQPRRKALEQLEPLFEAVARGMPVGAHNAQFERLIWTKVCTWFPVVPDEDQWDCTAARARALAIPGSLDGAALAVGLGIQKDPRGRELINIFSKPTKKGVRTYPHERPEDFEAFIEYCKKDVEVERRLEKILPPLSDREKETFALDYRINDRGILVDVDLVKKAHDFVEEYSAELMKKSIAISGYRPTQREKTLAYLSSRGIDLPNLTAPVVEELARKEDTPADIKELLDYRIELSRAGTKKLKAILASVSADGRLRGQFLYSAASTRRWSSQGVQVHNLQKPEGEANPDVVFQLLAKDPDLLRDMFDRPLTVLAQSIRGFFTSPDHLLVADYASVEPRGLAWLSDEEWILQAYRDKQDLYKIMASRVYGVPVGEVDAFLRFMGKQLVLGCGYGMGPPRFIETCAKFGTTLTLEQSAEAVYGYRKSVKNITRFWRSLEACCIKAIRDWKTIRNGYLRFRPATLSNGFRVLYVDMPSGTICYPKPFIGQELWNGQVRGTFKFWTPLGSHWVPTDTFGGSLAENVVQALTRDILRDGLLGADKAGHKVVAHVHDEAVAEGRNNKDDLADFEHRLSTSSEWAADFPIGTEGYIARRYKK